MAAPRAAGPPCPASPALLSPAAAAAPGPTARHARSSSCRARSRVGGGATPTAAPVISPARQGCSPPRPAPHQSSSARRCSCTAATGSGAPLSGWRCQAPFAASSRDPPPSLTPTVPSLVIMPSQEQRTRCTATPQPSPSDRPGSWRRARARTAAAATAPCARWV
eukprot:COSAG01_NODE_1115_length_11643_cov_197.836798_5_plen_165_part_00